MLTKVPGSSNLPYFNYIFFPAQRLRPYSWNLLGHSPHRRCTHSKHIFCLKSMALVLLLPNISHFSVLLTSPRLTPFSIYTRRFCFHFGFWLHTSVEEELYCSSPETLKQLPFAKGTGEILRLCPVYNIFLIGGCYFRLPLRFFYISGLAFWFWWMLLFSWAHGSGDVVFFFLFVCSKTIWSKKKLNSVEPV